MKIFFNYNYGNLRFYGKEIKNTDLSRWKRAVKKAVGSRERELIEIKKNGGLAEMLE